LRVRIGFSRIGFSWKFPSSSAPCTGLIFYGRLAPDRNLRENILLRGTLGMPDVAAD
jgi:hypothetical protein